jgi:Histone methylation protein DOT1
MSDFSDEEDRTLVQLVLAFYDDKGKIDWNSVAGLFPAQARKTKQVLRQRLKTLKRTYGSFRAFPKQLIGQSQCPPARASAASATLPQASGGNTDMLVSGRDLYNTIGRIFSSFSKADVRQPSGQANMNTGEIAPIGITRLLDRLHLTPNDTFGDIGSGTGNVLAQVALQTSVKKCVGLELRDAIADKSRRILKMHSIKFSRLSCVSVLSGDIKSVDGDMKLKLMECSVIFSNNKVFAPETNIHLEQFICSSAAVSKVVLSNPFCVRCKPRCMREFCQIWKLDEQVLVETCWSMKLLHLSVFTRRL